MAQNYEALYNEAIDTIISEKEYSAKLYKLNEDLVKLNNKVSKISNETMSENIRMKEVLNHGAFIEYSNDPSTIKFIPVLSDITNLLNNPSKPTKLMFTFQFSDFEKWAMNLHNLMIDNKEAVEIINKRDLE